MNVQPSAYEDVKRLSDRLSLIDKLRLIEHPCQLLRRDIESESVKNSIGTNFLI